MAERRVAVADLGSNSFRLVVFTASDEGWWKKTDEIYETVRIGEGLGASGKLGRKALDRALNTIDLFATFARTAGVEDVRAVATSAIRDAKNRDDLIERAGLPVRVLSREEEALHGYLAAINSTTLTDGAVLDIGGGSLQLVEVAGRKAIACESWPLGAVRMTERFLPDGKASRKGLKALRAHVTAELEQAKWLRGAGRRGRLVGIGGSVRNLAAAAATRDGLALPSIQGYRLTRDALAELVGELAARPPAKRAQVPGIKDGRADVILAAAYVVLAAMDAGGFEELEATEWGLREGVFLAEQLAPETLIPDVRGAAVRNLAAQYQGSLAHAEHVACLAVTLWDSLGRERLHGGAAEERELLDAAALLHDIGTFVDYDDHHKHGRYLILASGLPGFTPRELALVAQIVRYHRKGDPAPGEFKPLLRDGDAELLERTSSVLRLVERLERARSRLVHELAVSVSDGTVTLTPDAEGDLSVARWGAQNEEELFRRAFGRRLVVA